MTMIEASLLIVAFSLIASVLVQAVQSDIAFGLGYGASARDDEKSNVLSRRLTRVVRNQVEGVAMFAPLGILTATGQPAGGLLAFTCLVYAVSRPVHALLYAMGFRLLRSVVWLVGFGALMLGYGLWTARSIGLGPALAG